MNDGTFDIRRSFFAEPLLRRLAAWPYAAVTSLRRAMYHGGLLPSRRVSVPVICVGNITCGGTGKTPMTAWVVDRLKQIGRWPAVLTRGYKAVDGKSDEAMLLQRVTGVDVVVNPHRLAGAAAAIDDGANALVMDDGFQHLRMKRDLDIVLVDASNPFGSGEDALGCCLPTGRLREPRGVLADADVLVLTRSDNVLPDQVDDLKRLLARYTPSAPIATAVHKPVWVMDETGRQLSPKAVAGKRAFVFCGLGNPRAFLNTAIKLDVGIIEATGLEDHVEYTDERIADLCDAAEKCEAEIMLTTRKDGVKLAGKTFTKPVWQLGIQMDITDGRDDIVAAIQRTVDAYPLEDEV
ncbi:MAG: tetraacyldisaccharide 4'-kinase [Planctomycetes bacterium]|jgi:tetraacyldisaccharide 4'-kinase|nr:tetraacyldisaccharide 4'-kinase [Planctomycetota bacterium]